jgi:hypothetical protein
MDVLGKKWQSSIKQIPFKPKWNESTHETNPEVSNYQPEFYNICA